MLRIYAAMAQKERELISERTRLGRAGPGRPGGRSHRASGAAGADALGVDPSEEASLVRRT